MSNNENVREQTIDSRLDTDEQASVLQKFSDLLQQFDEIQQQISFFVDGGQKELARFKSKLNQMNTTKADTTEVKRLGDQLQVVANQLGTMENGLLAEFRVSQSLMRNMIEHDMTLETQKVALKLEMDRKKADIESSLLEQQNQMNLEREKEREAWNLEREKEKIAFKRKLIFQIGGIITPIIAAATAAVIKIIESL